MDTARFSASPAGRLVRAGAPGAEYDAFLPHPLPPELSYDAEMAVILATAAASLGELAGLAHAMPYPALVTRPFVRREAVLSSRIEGTRTNVAELYAHEVGQRPGGGVVRPEDEPDIQEVLNYVHALDHGLARIAEVVVGVPLMCELHERLMAGVRGGAAAPGQLRDRQNWIGQRQSTLFTAIYVPPPPDRVPGALDALATYIASPDAHPALVRLALLHYQFEAIHPFRDGNGRVGRLLVTLLLTHWRLLPAPLLYLSAYFEAHRREYYDGLLRVSRDGAWRDWVVFFLTGVHEESRDAAHRARRLLNLQSEWHARLLSGTGGARLVRLADALFDTPILTVSRAQAHLGVSYNAAQRNLEKLVAAGILREVRPGPARLFEAPAILAIVGEGG